jgi:hypothetical protein
MDSNFHRSRMPFTVSVFIHFFAFYIIFFYIITEGIKIKATYKDLTDAMFEF